MLIKSHRHTPEDLRLWRELEEADKLHGRSMLLYRKVGHAIAAIRSFAAKGRCYAALSFGKDSTVLAGLIREASIDVPLAWVRVEPICNPECAQVRDAMFPEWKPRYVEVESHCTFSHGQWHASGTLENGIRGIAERVGTSRCLLGIRAKESGARKLSAFVHGEATEVKCRPILFWDEMDVFGYLASRNLPVHPVYAMLGGGRWQRGRLRVSSLGGRRGDGMGRAEWEKEYYGDVLNQIRAGIHHPLHPHDSVTPSVAWITLAK